MLQLRGQHGAFRCAVTLLICVVVAGRSDARRGDGSGMTDEEVVKWMEENPERLDEIMEEMTADMREEHQLAGHARQVALIQAATSDQHCRCLPHAQETALRTPKSAHAHLPAPHLEQVALVPQNDVYFRMFAATHLPRTHISMAARAVL